MRKIPAEIKSAIVVAMPTRLWDTEELTISLNFQSDICVISSSTCVNTAGAT